MADDLFALVGTVVDQRYVVEAVVGEGGFGVVYRARHQDLTGRVAIKVLKVPHHFPTDAKNLLNERFREEGRTLSKLAEHPNIVRVLHYGLLDATDSVAAGAPYLVLEWLDGTSLEEELDHRRAMGGGTILEAEALELMIPVVDALAYAHQSGVAHRDIKPANIILIPRGRRLVPKLVDFGIAKAMQEGERRSQLLTHTSSGFHAFSPQYGAPEQFQPKRFGPTGPWTDVHAIGLVLCEMVTGRAVFDGEELADVIVSATAAHRPTPQRRGVPISDRLEVVCLRATARDPSHRYRDAGELLVALRGIAEHGPRPPRETVAAAPAPGWSVPAPPRAVMAVPVRPSPIPTPPPRPKKNRSRVGSIVAYGAGIATLSIGGAVLVDRLRDTEEHAVPEERADRAAADRPAPGSSAPPAEVGALEVACPTNPAACVELANKHRDWRTSRDDARALGYAEKGCQAGDARGCAVLGEMYAQGAGVTRDSRRAAEYYKKSCDANEPEGCVDLGLAMLFGLGTAVDPNGARLLDDACSSGFTRGCTALGRALLFGKGVAVDANRALSLHDRACDAGDAQACRWLGYEHVMGLGTTQNDSAALAAYGRACDGGDAVGCYGVGFFHEFGRAGLSPDREAAVSRYDRACYAREALGCEALVRVLGPTDAPRATSLLEQSCAAGSSPACTVAGLHGPNQGRDAASQNLLNRACTARDPLACYHLGVSLRDSDAVLARERFAVACEEGYGPGCSELGRHAEGGLGGPVDPQRAFQFYDRACALQNGTAADEIIGCVNLAHVYREGIGVVRNIPESERLYQMACAQGYQPACTVAPPTR